MKLRTRIVLLPITVLVVLVSPSLGHLPFNGEGVHFKNPAIDFGDPPSRYAMSFLSDSMGNGGPDAWRPGTTYVFRSPNYEEKREESTEPDPYHLYKKATSLEEKGNYAGALSRWRWGWNHGLGDPSFERERIALLSTAVHHPHLKGVDQLVRSTTIQGRSGDVPRAASLAPLLQPFGLYRSIDESKTEGLEKAKAFWSLAEKYPHSPMTEGALISIPRLLLGHGNQKKMTDQQILFSRSALDALMEQFPHTRFRWDVIGWRSRIDFLKNRYPVALVGYRRQFRLAVGASEKIDALRSIIFCEKALSKDAAVAAARLTLYGVAEDKLRKLEGADAFKRSLSTFSGKDARLFWNLLSEQPQLLAFYLDYRLEMSHPTSELLSLAKDHCDKALRSKFRAHILARLAEACNRFRRYGEAERYANRSLRSHPDKGDCALDTYLLASLAKRSGQYRLAQSRFENLVRRFPHYFLCDGARENLALLYERDGRTGDALDIYRKLNYDYDVTYLLDVRMSLSEVGRYVNRRPKDREIDLLRLSLGMRYLRADRFEAARSQFLIIGRKKRIGLIADVWRETDDDGKLLPFPDPLKPVNDLEHLYRAYRKANGYEAKAEALTQIADYYYEKRDLLLYNVALWKEERARYIDYSWNPKVASSTDSRRLEQHQWDHDCLARTYRLCEIVRAKYPHSAARYRVAYRQACAAEHLSNLNGYWRWEADRKHLLRKAVTLMKVAMKSPDKKLAAMATKYKEVFAGQRDDREQAFRQEQRDARLRHKSNGFPNAQWMENFYE